MAELDLSQAELARQLEVTRGTVWHWINDERFPSRKHLPKLAKVLQTTIGELHGEKAA